MHALRRILDDIRAVVRAGSMPHSHLRDRLSAALTLTFVVATVAGMFGAFFSHRSSDIARASKPVRPRRRQCGRPCRS